MEIELELEKIDDKLWVKYGILRAQLTGCELIRYKNKSIGFLNTDSTKSCYWKFSEKMKCQQKYQSLKFILKSLESKLE